MSQQEARFSCSPNGNWFPNFNGSYTRSDVVLSNQEGKNCAEYLYGNTLGHQGLIDQQVGGRYDCVRGQYMQNVQGLFDNSDRSLFPDCTKAIPSGSVRFSCNKDKVSGVQTCVADSNQGDLYMQAAALPGGWACEKGQFVQATGGPFSLQDVVKYGEDCTKAVEDPNNTRFECMLNADSVPTCLEVKDGRFTLRPFVNILKNSDVMYSCDGTGNAIVDPNGPYTADDVQFGNACLPGGADNYNGGDIDYNSPDSRDYNGGRFDF